MPFIKMVSWLVVATFIFTGVGPNYVFALRPPNISADNIKIPQISANPTIYTNLVEISSIDWEKAEKIGELKIVLQRLMRTLTASPDLLIVFIAYEKFGQLSKNQLELASLVAIELGLAKDTRDFDGKFNSTNIRTIKIEVAARYKKIRKIYLQEFMGDPTKLFAAIKGEIESKIAKAKEIPKPVSSPTTVPVVTEPRKPLGPKTVEPAQIPPPKERPVVKKESPELRQLNAEGLEDYLAELPFTVPEKEKTLKDLIKMPELPEVVKKHIMDKDDLKLLEKYRKVTEILSKLEKELKKNWENEKKPGPFIINKEIFKEAISELELSEQQLKNFLAIRLSNIRKEKRLKELKSLIQKSELPKIVKNRLGDEKTLKRLEEDKKKIAEILSRWEEELRKKNFKDDEIERLLGCGLLPGYISEDRLSNREAMQLAKRLTNQRRTDIAKAYKEIVEKMGWPRAFALQLAIKKPLKWREAPSIYQDIKKYMPDFPEDGVMELVIYNFDIWREGAKERLVREVLKAQDRKELIAILNKYGQLELFVGMISRLPSEIAKELSNKKDAEIKDLILELNKVKVSSNKVISKLVFLLLPSNIELPSLGPEWSFYKNSAEIETIDWKGFDETGFKIALEKMLRTVISYDLLGTNPLIVYLASKKLEELNEEQLNIAIPVLKQSGLAESKKRLNEIIAYNKKLSAIEYLVKEGFTREELQKKNLEGLFGLIEKRISLKTRGLKKPKSTKVSKILAGLVILFFALPLVGIITAVSPEPRPLPKPEESWIKRFKNTIRVGDIFNLILAAIEIGLVFYFKDFVFKNGLAVIALLGIVYFTLNYHPDLEELRSTKITDLINCHLRLVSKYLEFLKPVWPEKGLVIENSDKISQELAVIVELYEKFTSQEKERIIRRLFDLAKTEKDRVIIHKAICVLLKVIPLTMERREVTTPEMEELFRLLEENVNKPVAYLPYPETDLTDIMGFEPLIYELLKKNEWAYIDRVINILDKIFKQRQLSGQTYFYWGRENRVIPFSLMRLALLIGDKDIQRGKSIGKTVKDWPEYATLMSEAIQADSNIEDILYEGIDRLPRSLSNLLNEFEKLDIEKTFVDPPYQKQREPRTHSEIISQIDRSLKKRIWGRIEPVIESF